MSMVKRGYHGNVLKQFSEGFWKYSQSSSLRVFGNNLNWLLFDFY
jgi:hypothetical protein